MEFFKKSDTNHDGMISSEELKKSCEDNHIFLDEKQFIKNIDVNNDNMINYSEFLMAFYDFKNFLDKNKIKQIFDMVDFNKNKFISKNELMKFLNIENDNPLLNEIIGEADVDNDNKISFDEFSRCLENLFLKLN